MQQQEYYFSYEIYDATEELDEADAVLLRMARETTVFAYAPYSGFHVGAVARLANGEIVKGTNQENASYPVGICAERVLLSSASSQYPGTSIKTIAISYHNKNGESNKPVSPCGICRQTLTEYEERQTKNIRLILSGMTGKVIVISTTKSLLPLSFGNADLK